MFSSTTVKFMTSQSGKVEPLKEGVFLLPSLGEEAPNKEKSPTEGNPDQ